MYISVLSISILIILLILSVVYVFSRKVITYTVAGVHALFFLAILVALLAILVPAAFDAFAETIVEESQLGKNIEQVDGTVETVITIPGDIGNSITDFLSGNETDADKAEIELYENTVSFVAGVIRWTTFAVALIISLLLLYLKYSIGGTAEISQLTSRIDELEGQVDALTATSEE